MNVAILLKQVSELTTAEKLARQQQTEYLLQSVFFRISTLREAKQRFAHQLALDFRLFDFLRTCCFPS